MSSGFDAAGTTNDQKKGSLKQEVSITKRVGYVAENDVKKGVCGYDSCPVA